MPITERGRLVFGVIDERGKRIFGSITEQGHFVTDSAVTQPPTTGTAVTYSYSSRQQVYKFTSGEYNTQQQYFIAVQSMTDLKQLINRSQALNYDTRQIISKGITTHIQTLQSMYENNTLDYDVLIQMINDYKEYKKIVKGDLFIIRSATGELLISRKAKDDIHI